MDKQNTLIEINGVKMEVDLRTARRVDTLQVGSRVKVLVKTYSEYKVYPGVIIGFDDFKNLPTINVAYLDMDYSGAHLKFIPYNANTKETEIVAAVDNDHLEINRADVLAQMERAETAKENELRDLRERREFFVRQFAAYFADLTPATAAV